MKSERLFRVLGLVDDDLIEEAASPATGGHGSFRKWMAAAACLAVLCAVGAGWLITGGFRGMGSSAPGESGSGIASNTEPTSEEGTTFMSYAGPVFPLTLAEETNALTAERETTWDFAPDTYHDGTPRQWGASVTDSYTLVNITDFNQTVTTLYPFVGSFTELETQRPAVTVDGADVEGGLYIGSYAGDFQGVWQSDGQGGYALDDTTLNLSHPDSWMDYKALLADGRYLDAALGDGPVLDIPVTVYEFTDFQAPEGYDAATQAIEFTIDQEKTAVYSYGFNGGAWDVDTGWQQRSYFVPGGQRREKDLKLLVVLGDDIGDYVLQGYKDGGCDRGEELEGVDCTVTRRETTLDEVLDLLCREYLETYAGWQYGMEDDAVSAVPFALFRRAVGEMMVQYGPVSEAVKDRYADGRLDDIISEAMSQERVLYLAVQVTVPAESKVNISFSLWKEPSFDFGCSGSENVGLQGYDFVTRLGANLTFTGQQAALKNTDGIQIERQNFGFDLEKGVTEVTLDLKMEHYYLEIRPKE